jgi:hypothetical protein
MSERTIRGALIEFDSVEKAVAAHDGPGYALGTNVGVINPAIA